MRLKCVPYIAHAGYPVFFFFSDKQCTCHDHGYTNKLRVKAAACQWIFVLRPNEANVGRRVVRNAVRLTHKCLTEIPMRRKNHFTQSFRPVRRSLSPRCASILPRCFERTRPAKQWLGTGSALVIRAQSGS